jgi:uncharacterized DUF497 family protein
VDISPAFEWDADKDLQNFLKHGVRFEQAQHAFLDANAVIAEDQEHSQQEPRFYCVGRDASGEGVLTVRFTYRAG